MTVVCDSAERVAFGYLLLILLMHLMKMILLLLQLMMLMMTTQMKCENYYF